MDGQAFDAMTRHAAAAVSRRGSLLTLGGAALAASLFGPALVEAKKGGKKKNKKCRNQAGKCRQLLPVLVGDVASEEKVDFWVQLLKECCDFLGDCDVARAVRCVTDKTAPG